MRKELIRKSKFLSLALRHDPSAANVTLDDNGWVEVPKLLEGAASKGIDISFEELIEIVDTNEKRRFTICQETNRIRANQGHSIAVDLELKEASPPAVLYHGTTVRNRDSILQRGLLKMKRRHVHLSTDIETARKVGARHGKILILKVDASAMQADGHVFYLSENGVWLTESVPAAYLTERVK